MWNSLIITTQYTYDLPLKITHNKELQLFIWELLANHSMVPLYVWADTYMTLI